MKVYNEISVRYFDFWQGGKDRAEFITENYPEKWDEIESFLDECYPDGISNTELNDIFWFDDDFFNELGCGYNEIDE